MKFQRSVEGDTHAECIHIPAQRIYVPDKPYSFSRALMIGAEVKPPTESPDNVKPIARAAPLVKILWYNY